MAYKIVPKTEVHGVGFTAVYDTCSISGGDGTSQSTYCITLPSLTIATIRDRPLSLSVQVLALCKLPTPSNMYVCVSAPDVVRTGGNLVLPVCTAQGGCGSSKIGNLYIGEVFVPVNDGWQSEPTDGLKSVLEAEAAQCSCSCSCNCSCDVMVLGVVVVVQ